MLLTAFTWLPTLRALEQTSRYAAMHSLQGNPADHRLSCEWLLPLLVPNVLGNPASGTYTPPRGRHPAVLDDYGEVASGYSGLATLGLALAAPFVARRRRGFAFAAALMLVALLTIAETPLWRDAVRALPLAGISLLQRLRILWNLGVCIAATLTLDALAGRASRRSAALALFICIAAFLTLYAWRRPPMHDAVSRAQALAPVVAAAATAAMLLFRNDARIPLAIAALVFCDLVLATWRYNPPANAADVYPITGAIARLRSGPRPSRFAAIGWSFLPDTPSYYGIEDVKTTDPMQNDRYMRLLRGYLRTSGYDLAIGDVTQPFFDFLNIRYVYVPPDQSLRDARFVERYRGADGVLLENTRALPRYLLVRACAIEPDFGMTVWRSREIRDFRDEALVDRIPSKIRRMGLDPPTGDLLLSGGTVRVVHYGGSTTEMQVHNAAWALLVTSEVSWRGWRVYVNGQRLPPVVVNGAFVGCFIPPGGGRVVLRYRPDEYDRALRCGGATLLLLASLTAAWTRCGCRRRRLRSIRARRRR